MLQEIIRDAMSPFAAPIRRSLTRMIPHDRGVQRGTLEVKTPMGVIRPRGPPCLCDTLGGNPRSNMQIELQHRHLVKCEAATPSCNTRTLRLRALNAKIPSTLATATVNQAAQMDSMAAAQKQQGRNAKHQITLQLLHLSSPCAPNSEIQKLSVQQL